MIAHELNWRWLRPKGPDALAGILAKTPPCINERNYRGLHIWSDQWDLVMC